MMDEHIVKSEGITPSERYLQRLCEKTFLSLWSYAGVFRDQGKAKAGDGKEICDMLVIFEHDILIFSDKYCEYPNTGNLLTDWNRWFKRAVLKSAEQLWGAERWIKSFPDRIFLDRQCKMKFPIPIPNDNDVRYHLVVVAHDSSKRCRELLGGSGSLMLDSSLIGDGHYTNPGQSEFPFTIGDLNPAKTFVHIFDDYTLVHCGGNNYALRVLPSGP